MEQEISGISKFPEKKTILRGWSKFPTECPEAFYSIRFLAGILGKWDSINICLIDSKNMQQYVLYKETETRLAT